MLTRPGGGCSMTAILCLYGLTPPPPAAIQLHLNTADVRAFKSTRQRSWKIHWKKKQCVSKLIMCVWRLHVVVVVRFNHDSSNRVLQSTAAAHVICIHSKTPVCVDSINITYAFVNFWFQWGNQCEIRDTVSVNCRPRKRQHLLIDTITHFNSLVTMGLALV